MKFVVKKYHTGDRPYAPGEIRDLDAADAGRLIEMGVLHSRDEMDPADFERLAAEAFADERAALEDRRTRADEITAALMGQVAAAREAAEAAEKAADDAEAVLADLKARHDAAISRAGAAEGGLDLLSGDGGADAAPGGDSEKPAKVKKT